MQGACQLIYSLTDSLERIKILELLSYFFHSLGASVAGRNIRVRFGTFSPIEGCFSPACESWQKMPGEALVPGHPGPDPLGRGHCIYQVLLPVGRGHKPGLELGTRQINALCQHALEKGLELF